MPSERKPRWQVPQSDDHAGERMNLDRLLQRVALHRVEGFQRPWGDQNQTFLFFLEIQGCGLFLDDAGWDAVSEALDGRPVAWPRLHSAQNYCEALSDLHRAGIEIRQTPARVAE